MSIRQSLLAILGQGPCYGYQLRLEFERRTGGTWPVNVGQVYATLERLERDGLVSKSSTADTGHVYYAITSAGSAAATDWLQSPAERSGRDEAALKLVLAMTLPGADAHAIITTQRAATAAALAGYRSEAGTSPSRRLLVESLALAAEAELHWLDHCEAALASSTPYGLDAELPRRGRPTRV